MRAKVARRRTDLPSRGSSIGIASSGVDCVVVHRLDRLTRSVADWAKLVAAFKRRGTKLVVVAGDIHLGDLAMSDLVLNVLATFGPRQSWISCPAPAGIG